MRKDNTTSPKSICGRGCILSNIFDNTFIFVLFTAIPSPWKGGWYPRHRMTFKVSIVKERHNVAQEKMSR